MKGHGEKLSRKQDQAIAALLAEPSLATAAARAGVAESTLARWLADLEFARAYRAARRAAVEHAVTTLQQACGEAVATLRQALTCDTPNVRVRAALGILDQAVRGIELTDVLGRLDQLEQRTKEKERP